MRHITHFGYSCNQNILKKRVEEIDLVNRETQSDINQYKVELANAQSGKQPVQCTSWGIQKREINNLTYLMKKERRKKERRKKEEKKNRREIKERRKGWKRG